ncbi:hypothetical protein BT96DRAFT_874412 [Gymnopus androsaceus JB14]|uniref:MOCS2A n=1 Tax=Gymnopus androsaceus JB14 TaxID=1447944 RepID=A0A6A4IDI8_9AGAR|nr:hypothetical protein BT96DRAFT_874412 [Gymnopus androsaceus JB14]
MSSTSNPTSTACIKVLYFAASSTAVGLTEETVPIPPNSKGFFLSELADLLVERHSNHGGKELKAVLASSQWCVDAEMVEDGDLATIELKDGMEVAVICPVSGG